MIVDPLLRVCYAKERQAARLCDKSVTCTAGARRDALSVYAMYFGHRLLALIFRLRLFGSTLDAASHLEVCCTVSINGGGPPWAVRHKAMVGRGSGPA